MRILIAEDDPKLRKSLVHIFEINHYAVDSVDNGVDALEFASSDEYDGLVLDIMMPGGKNPFESMLSGATDYIKKVYSAMNLTVVVEMIGVGLLLTLIASAASVLFIMRYDPLKILANRD